MPRMFRQRLAVLPQAIAGWTPEQQQQQISDSFTGILCDPEQRSLIATYGS